MRGRALTSCPPRSRSGAGRAPLRISHIKRDTAATADPRRVQVRQQKRFAGSSGVRPRQGNSQQLAKFYRLAGFSPPREEVAYALSLKEVNANTEATSHFLLSVEDRPCISYRHTCPRLSPARSQPVRERDDGRDTPGFGDPGDELAPTPDFNMRYPTELRNRIVPCGRAASREGDPQAKQQYRPSAP